MLRKALTGAALAAFLVVSACGGSGGSSTSPTSSQTTQTVQQETPTPQTPTPQATTPEPTETSQPTPDRQESPTPERTTSQPAPDTSQVVTWDDPDTVLDVLDCDSGWFDREESNIGMSAKCQNPKMFAAVFVEPEYVSLFLKKATENLTKDPSTLSEVNLYVLTGSRVVVFSPNKAALIGAKANLRIDDPITVVGPSNTA